MSGIVGFTDRGSLFPESEEASYSMDVGDIVGPIKTRAGYHIIKLLDKRGDKIKTQHLLKVVSPTEEDKQETVLHINDIYEKASKNPLFLENYIESSYPFSVESLSGNYNDLPLSRLPDQIYDLVKNSEGHKLYEPIILQQNQSILLLYVYDVFPERVANLENSYDFIKSAALNKKIVDFLNEWLFLAKQDVYINFLEK